MNFFWKVLRGSDNRVEVVEGYPSLDAVIAEMGVSSWEEPGNAWLSFATDESGEVAAVALFGPEMELLVTCTDGRRLVFKMPERYRS